MLFADVVAASAAVAATSARSAKVAVLAELLRRLAPDEIVPATAFLISEPRQGKVGVGWARLRALEVPPAPLPTLTVLDVDAALDRLAATSGTGSGVARDTQLAALLSRATVDEAGFLTRLLLGELRQGALAGVVAEAVAKAAGVGAPSVRRAAMLAGDLPRTARIALVDGQAGVEAVGLSVLNAVQPMLAASSPNVADAVAAVGRASVEWKLDGARIQAHRAGDDVRLFTRNLNDVTARLPDVVEVVRGLPADRLVLDGEVLGVGDDDSPERFQDSMSRFSRHAGGVGALRVFFFDVLHAGGDDLLDRPLVERSAVLDDLAGPWRIPALMTDDADEAQRFLDDALSAGHEGVMVKDADSPYEAGRRGRAWRKVKPVRTLDLVVLGVEWGSGRRRGWLSNIHLGARDPGTPDRFVMVGKTFKGLTDDMLRWQTERFLQLEVGREGHVVWLRPEQVVEIALDGVQASSRYPGGVALRFARVRRYRDDKRAIDADTIDTVRALLR